MGAERRGGFAALREDEAGRARRAEKATIDVKLTTRDIVHSVWRGFGAAACGGHLTSLSGTGALLASTTASKTPSWSEKKIQPGKLLSNQPAKIVC